jgi:hypothetical protein
MGQNFKLLIFNTFQATNDVSRLETLAMFARIVFI